MSHNQQHHTSNDWFENQVKNTEDIYNPFTSYGIWGSIWLLLLDKQLAHHLHPNLSYLDIIKIDPFIQSYCNKTYIPISTMYYNMLKILNFTNHLK